MENTTSCSCGQLSLTFYGDIMRTSICHCFACQKRTRSVFGVQTKFEKAKVSIKGNSTAYDRPTDEGDHVQFHFCPICGSTIYWEIADLPDHYIVAVGGFSNPSLPSPIFSFYEYRKHHWVELPETIEVHD